MDLAARKIRGVLVSKLIIDSLSISYDEGFALSNINLEVSQGEMVALIGPNGAGKSTLLKAITGILSPKSGMVSFKGKKLGELDFGERARVLASVPQARIVGGAFTVEQTVMMGRTAHMNWLGRAQKKDKDIVDWAMKATQISRFEKRRNAELSGGELQRVLLARALAQSTPMLLMDEPTNHLDLKHQLGFLSLVHKLTRQENKGVLMALHDLNLVSRFADKVALIVDGQLLIVGKPAEVLKADIVSHAYDTDIEVFHHPEHGTPLLFPKRK